MVTGTENPIEEDVLPKVAERFVSDVEPVGLPALFTVTVQGSTLIKSPTSIPKKILPVPVMALILNEQEPKTTVPVAVVPPFFSEKPAASVEPAGGAVKATVVSPVILTGAPLALVPEKPLLKVSVVGAAVAVAGISAATVLAVMGATRLAAATVGFGAAAAGELSPPQPPMVVTTPASASKLAITVSLNIFFMSMTPGLNER